MSEDDLHRIAVAAADKEDAAFELDHADLNLKEAVVVALEHGAPPEVIAEVADFEPEEVFALVQCVEEPTLPTLDALSSPEGQEPAPAMQSPIVQDAS